MDKDVYNPNKFILHKDALVKIANREFVPPVNFQIDLTNKCNNRCLWCFYDVYPLPEFTRKQVLDKDKLFAFLEDLKVIGGQSIEWTGGGEPTMHPDFVEIVNKARELGFHQAMVTNGKKLSGDIADVVKDFDWVRVSLNSASAKMYKIQHGNDSFLRVINNIECFSKIKASNCVLGVSMIVDKNNWIEIADMTYLAKKNLGADNARIGIPQTPENEKLFEGIWDKVVEKMEKADSYQEDNFSVFTFSNRIEVLSHKTTSKRCYYHHLTPSLGANGVIYPCCHFKYLPEYNLGNINETPFSELWEGPVRKSFIDSTGENCKASCWFNDKNKLADYIIKKPEDVPHLAYP